MTKLYQYDVMTCDEHKTICSYTVWEISTILGKQAVSQNHLRWKRPLRSSSTTINFTLSSRPLNHISKISHFFPESRKYVHKHVREEQIKNKFAELSRRMENLTALPLLCTQVFATIARQVASKSKIGKFSK